MYYIQLFSVISPNTKNIPNRQPKSYETRKNIEIYN